MWLRDEGRWSTHGKPPVETGGTAAIGWPGRAKKIPAWMAGDFPMPHLGCGVGNVSVQAIDGPAARKLVPDSCPNQKRVAGPVISGVGDVVFDQSAGDPAGFQPPADTQIGRPPFPAGQQPVVVVDHDVVSP